MEILLVKIMYEKNISVRQLEYMSGVPKSTISDIMNGRTSPRLDTLEQLARALDSRITDLFESDIK